MSYLKRKAKYLAAILTLMVLIVAGAGVAIAHDDGDGMSGHGMMGEDAMGSMMGDDMMEGMMGSSGMGSMMHDNGMGSMKEREGVKPSEARTRPRRSKRGLCQRASSLPELDKPGDIPYYL